MNIESTLSNIEKLLERILNKVDPVSMDDYHFWKKLQEEKEAYEKDNMKGGEL